MVAFRFVVEELRADERVEACARKRRAAAVFHDRHAMIDRQPSDDRARIGELIARDTQPPRREGDGVGARQALPSQRLGDRQEHEVRPDRLLHEAPKLMREREALRDRAQRHEPVAVDRFDAHRQARRRAREHATEEEERRVVGDHHACVPCERFDQPSAIAITPLDVGKVERPRRAQRSLVVTHPVDHERMVSIARPRVGDAQRFEHDERSPELDRPSDRALEREVESRATRGRHPIEHERSVGPHVAVVRGPHAGRRHVAADRAHRFLRTNEPTGTSGPRRGLAVFEPNMCRARNTIAATSIAITPTHCHVTSVTRRSWGTRPR